MLAKPARSVIGRRAASRLPQPAPPQNPVHPTEYANRPKHPDNITKKAPQASGKPAHRPHHPQPHPPIIPTRNGCRAPRPPPARGNPQPPSTPDATRTMPTARNGTIELYYETTGTGPPILLISGQAMTLDAWWRTVPQLAQNFQVITYDHRDIGRSSHWPWPYLITHMADDAIAVLNAAHIHNAHIYGISLGGMIAQELALRHPDRVNALILGASTAGGTEATLATPQPLTFFIRAGAMAPEEAEWAAVPYNYSLNTRRHHGDRIAQDIAKRVQHQTNTLAYLHQIAAAAAHNTITRLHHINTPTLITHGAEDQVIPPRNAHTLHNTIPHAQLKIWPNAGHLYTTDEPQADQHINQFLLQHTTTIPQQHAA
jgi:3-oxoadipate enol-lactonase